MYCGSGTAAQTASQSRHTRSTHKRAAGGRMQQRADVKAEPPSWKYDINHTISKIWLRQSKRIYLQNNPAKFHPYPIWNEGALGFLKRVAPIYEFPENNVGYKRKIIRIRIRNGLMEKQQTCTQHNTAWTNEKHYRMEKI